MVKGIILNQRDFALLLDCYENVQLSFSQVHKRHFSGLSRSTATNRVSKLRKAGYLLSRKVGIVLYQSEPEEIGVVYQVTRRTIARLRQRFVNRAFRENAPRLNTLALPHDLLLTDVLTALCRHLPQESVQNGKVFFSKSHQGMRFPDGVIVDANGKPFVAIELELTTKSADRYRKLILSYKLQQDFPKILYIAGTDSMARVLRYHITVQRMPDRFALQTPSRFHVVTVAEVLGKHFQLPDEIIPPRRNGQVSVA